MTDTGLIPFVPPSVIYLIPAGEGQLDATQPPYGVEVTGEQNVDSLVPRGWQRAGGLATLFDTAVGVMRPDLSRPGQLFALSYGSLANTVNHRPYQTILPLSLRLALNINTVYPESREKELADCIVTNVCVGGTGTPGQVGPVTLVCWEHSRIPNIANFLPLATNVTVPAAGTGGRLDVIWCFTMSTDEPGTYTFSSLPELLLDGDAPV